MKKQWDFIFQTLTFFNFGVSIKKWIKCFYQNISSCVIQNGILSQYFNPQRGCRQGDPVSPYLFILCAEILGILIRNNRDIKGIEIDGEEYKISQYADDTSLISDGSASPLQTLDYFAEISGLKINISKTKLIWIGSKKFSKNVYHHTRWKFNLKETKFDLFGIKFSVNLDEMIDLDYTNKMEQILKLLKQWKNR